jgi:hypothetical protein
LRDLHSIEFETLRPYSSAPQDAQNEQTVELFQTETERLWHRTRRVYWAIPSLADDQEPSHLPTGNALDSIDAESPRAFVTGGAARGQILHKLMEEVAAALIAQLGHRDVVDPREGLNSSEFANCVLHTFSLPRVQEFPLLLVPEWNLYSAIEAEPGTFEVTAGVADAIAYDQQNQPIFVFDWKSDVAPDGTIMQKHRAQLGKYLAMTHCKHGAVVYMSSRQIIEMES